MERAEIQAKIWEAYESGHLIAACAWCARLALAGDWLRADKSALTAIDARVTLSHGICPSCLEAQSPELPAQQDLESSALA